MFRLIFFFILIVLACKPSGQQVEVLTSGSAMLTTLKMEHIPFQKRLFIDTMIQEIKYVFPETNDHYRIGSYDKIIVKEELIYIMDKTFRHAVLCVDFEGNYKFMISALGRGPGQYRELRDFVVDEENEEIEVLDFGGRSIKKYSSLTGDFKEEVPFPDVGQYYMAFEKLKDSYVAAHANNCDEPIECGNLTFHDIHFKTTKSYLPVNKLLLSHDYRGENHFFNNGEKIFYKEVFNDTIYEIDVSNNNVTGAYYIDFGPLQIPAEIKYSSKNTSLSGIIDYCINNQKTWGVYDFHYAGDFVFFNYSMPDLRNVFYNIKKISGCSFDRIITENPFLISAPKSSYGEYFINVTDAEFVYKGTRPFFGTDSIKMRAAYPDLFELTKGLKRDDNSVLTFYKLKSDENKDH